MAIIIIIIINYNSGGCLFVCRNLPFSWFSGTSIYQNSFSFNETLTFFLTQEISRLFFLLLHFFGVFFPQNCYISFKLSSDFFLFHLFYCCLFCCCFLFVFSYFLYKVKNSLLPQPNPYLPLLPSLITSKFGCFYFFKFFFFSPFFSPCTHPSLQQIPNSLLQCYYY